MTRSVCAAIALTLITSFSAVAEVSHHQGEAHATEAKAAIQYPQIVLYSVAWCPHCRETKEYLKKNDIPFINRDVELDTKAMEDLTVKYNSTRVPLVVFGKGADEIVMKGFTPELFQETLQKARLK
ncbi:MAG: glutaredoxin domain-containing protein [Desulfuromonadaceae bacterium]|nr:glutaredoxin domain-containing protein [Desulfuromonadaceae bacterium]